MVIAGSMRKRIKRKPLKNEEEMSDSLKTYVYSSVIPKILNHIHTCRYPAL